MNDQRSLFRCIEWDILFNEGEHDNGNRRQQG
jgi:hypothetical protein